MPEAVTMWDFSWLLRREGAEAEYADVDRVLDELAERGYDSVRIDAFPHWIADDAEGRHSEGIVALPQPPGFMWGNHQEVAVRPREELIRFLRGLRDRGLQAGLSTWFTPDREHRNSQVQSPGDLSRVWCSVLQLVEDAGLADTIRYVDLCNEWPGWSPGVNQAVFGTGPIERTSAWTAEQIGRIDEYQGALEGVREQHPGHPLTLSYFPRSVTTGAPEDLMRLSVAQQDLAEVHLWLSLVCPSFIEETAYVDDYSTDVHHLSEHQHLVAGHLDTRLGPWLDELAAVMDRWSAWADQHRLPLWTTEGWASIGWSPNLVDGWNGWDYVKAVGSSAVNLAVQRDWQGICTSNFSQPHHTGIWADVEWHQTLTRRIHAG